MKCNHEIKIKYTAHNHLSGIYIYIYIYTYICIYLSFICNDKYCKPLIFNILIFLVELQYQCSDFGKSLPPTK